MFSILQVDILDFRSQRKLCTLENVSYMSNFSCQMIIHQSILGVPSLRTEYKTRTRYKTRTTDYVYKNSFRKVKPRETESGLALNSSPSSLPHTQTFFWLVTHCILLNFSAERERILHGKGRLCRYSRRLKMKL